MITRKLNKKPWLNCVAQWRKDNNQNNGNWFEPHLEIKLQRDIKFEWNITVKEWTADSDTAFFNAQSEKDLTTFLLKWS